MGQTVRRLRKERRWTLAELAGRLRLSESRLSELERGKGSFSAEHLLALFGLFHVGPEAFLPADTLRDPVVGSIQKSLSKFGAYHLLADDTFLIRSEHARPVDVICDVLVRHPSPRFLTAIPPVLVQSSNEISFSAIQDAVVRAGVPHRWAWLLDRFLGALDTIDGGSVLWRRGSQRASVLAQSFLSQLSEPGSDATLDLLDRDVRSQATLRAALVRADEKDHKWRVLSRLTTEDFVAPLEALRDAL